MTTTGSEVFVDYNTSQANADCVSGECYLLDLPPEVVQITVSPDQSNSDEPSPGRHLLNRFKSRIKLEPAYPALVDTILFQDSAFQKLIPSVASMCLTSISHLSAGGAVLKELMPLLMKLAGGSLLSLCVGDLFKLVFPELAVLAMLVSKCLGFASFFILILNFLHGDPLCLIPVYLTILILVILLVFMVVEIFKQDVRKPPKEVEDGHL